MPFPRVPSFRLVGVAAALPILLLAGCVSAPARPAPSAPSSAESALVTVSGIVVDPRSHGDSTITISTLEGESLGTVQSDDAGAFEIRVAAEAPYLLSATNDAAGDTLDAMCFVATECSITPWSTLLTVLADEASESSHATIDASLRALDYFELPATGDPFVQALAGTLTRSGFDSAAILEAFEGDGGLSGWITSVRDWLGAPDTRTPPAGVPRFTVTANISGGSASPTVQDVPRGRTAQFTITGTNPFSVSGVSGCGAGISGTTVTTAAIVGDCVVSAKLTSGGSGKAPAKPAPASPAAPSIPAPSIPAPGGGTGPVAPTTYTLGYLAATGGAVAGDVAQTVVQGNDGSSVTAVPDAGYRFSRWSDGVTANPRVDANVVANLSVTAEFVVLDYSLRYAAAAGGSLTGAASQTVSHGGDGSSVTAVANAGYRFSRWSDGVTANPRVDANVVANLSVTAEFAGAHLAVGESWRQPYSSSVMPVRLSNTDSAAATYAIVSSNTGRAASGVRIALPDSDGAATVATVAAGTPDLTAAKRLRRDADIAAYLAHRGVPSATSPLVPAAQIPSGAVPVLGSTMQLNSTPTGQCLTGTSATGTVQFVGNNIVIVIDDANPMGAGGVHGFENGTSATTFSDLARSLDTVVYPAVVGLLGAAPDADGNGRVVVFVTAGMNRLEGPAQAVQEFARYAVTDRLPQAECATSNSGEVIYTMAPDVAGTVNSNVRNVSAVQGGIVTEAALALSLMIVDSQRADAQLDFQDPWIEDALASAARELTFFAAAPGMAPRRNIVLSDLTTGQNASVRVSAFNSYINKDFSNFTAFLQKTQTNGFMGTRGAGQQGAAWAFIRYAADRFATSPTDSDSTFFRALALADSNGLAAVSQVTGEDSDEWAADFFAAIYVDDLAAAGTLGSSGPYALPTWSYRSVYGGLGGFPLRAPAALAQGNGVSFPLLGLGTADYRLVSVPANGSLNLEFSATDPGAAKYTIIRLS